MILLSCELFHHASVIPMIVWLWVGAELLPPVWSPGCVHCTHPLEVVVFWSSPWEEAKEHLLLLWLAWLISQLVGTWHKCNHFRFRMPSNLQLKSHLSRLASLLPKIPLPLLQIWFWLQCCRVSREAESCFCVSLGSKVPNPLWCLPQKHDSESISLSPFLPQHL